MKNTIFIIFFISLIQCSYFEFETQISTSLDYSSTSIKQNRGISFGYSHSILKKSYFSIYAGFLYTISPLIFENNDLYSSESEQGLIQQCNNIISPEDTQVNIGYVFFSPQYMASDKVNIWFSLGINVFDINYLQLSHPYQLYEFVCNNCDDENYENDVEYYVLSDQCSECSVSFDNVGSFGGMGFGFGLDFKLNNNISISLGKYKNKNKNIGGYDVSVYEHKNFDVDISRYVFSIKYFL